ncbi:MAG: LppC family lipoprotein [Gammaproteobacteria bacterium HGW-Gammaproteobacteria-3]|nr:MAG: LppC family lipoprotein [Gammaproteobacteria bacterium HGW-Gammaproteobacteria-3]
MSRLFQYKLLLSALLLLAGCSNPAAVPINRAAPGKISATAQALQNQFKLHAIETLILSGNSQTAQSHANALDRVSLSAPQQNQLDLYYAQIDLSFGEAERALSRLHGVQPELLNSADLIQYHQARAFAYSLTGEPLKSAIARIALEPLLSSTQQQENHTAIIETLNLMPLSELEQNRPQSPTVLSGWIALVRILKLKNKDPALANDALFDWRLTYPQHPANPVELERYLTQTHPVFKQPAAIAVLLPESGTYAGVGNAIREGIKAASKQDHKPDKPVLRFYDSESAPLAALYQQAVAEGAELVIGPLSKPDLQSLADNVNFNIPVLALNHIPELNKANLYQFGLSPADDAEQIARKARLDSHRQALMLLPDTDLGARSGDYINDYWTRGGGTVLETQIYDPGQTDFSGELKKLLNLDESERRYHQLRRLIPDIHYVPRRRQDADVIFLNAYETAARSINPQLKFYRAGSIPVYATPQVYSGLPNSALDADLDAITFCDLPWLFTSVYPGALSLAALQETWAQFPAIYLRLIALGLDAYGVVAHLDTLSEQSYSGATGKLLLTGTYRIKRNLVCAKFTEGIPHVIGFIDDNEDSFEPAPEQDFESPSTLETPLAQ